MKVSKWVDFGQDVEVDISINDIAGAIAEAWGRVVNLYLDEQPTRNEVITAMSRSLQMFKALTDEQIANLTPEQRAVIAKNLAETAERFQVGGLFKNASTGAIAQQSGHTERGKGPDAL
jgi:hypothetical protein